MKSSNKEHEYSLIAQLLNLEKNIHYTKMNIEFSNTPKERLKNVEDLESLQRSLAYVSNELIEIEFPYASIELKEKLVNAFHEMRNAISDVMYDLPISRCQGMVLKNYFVSKILEVINNVIQLNFHGLYSPFLYFTSDPKDSFDRKRLIEFFNSEIEILKNIDPVNYIILQSYYKSFTERVAKMID